MWFVHLIKNDVFLRYEYETKESAINHFRKENKYHTRVNEYINLSGDHYSYVYQKHYDGEKIWTINKDENVIAYTNRIEGKLDYYKNE